MAPRKVKSIPVENTLNQVVEDLGEENKEVTYDDVVNLINDEKEPDNTDVEGLEAFIIQPVSNKDLNRIASGFGNRVDPVYKVRKFHAGLDFTAPTGTPIYATADGTIKDASFNAGGYGNHVIIEHGFGMQTLYGHMYKIKAKKGQSVKRGEVIGYVGSTGKSTGPHCHYEVHRNGVPVDPIYYFYNDLTPAQYDRILKSAVANSQSLD